MSKVPVQDSARIVLNFGMLHTFYTKEGYYTKKMDDWHITYPNMGIQFQSAFGKDAVYSV